MRRWFQGSFDVYFWWLQGLISYRDLSEEILNILKSKRDEIVFKMKLASKEEIDVLKKRVENLEKEIKKNKIKKKSK